MAALDGRGGAECPDVGLRLDAFQKIAAFRDLYDTDRRRATDEWRAKQVSMGVSPHEKLGAHDGPRSREPS